MQGLHCRQNEERFHLQNPGTEISISEYDNYLEVQEALLSGEIDKGLTLYPVIHPAIKYEVLKTGKLSVIMSKNHPLASGDTDIEQLLKTGKWIELSRKVHPVYKEIEDRCQLLGIQRQIIQEVSSLNLLISLVGLNNGIGFAPSLFDFTSEPNIVVKSLENTVFQDIEICHVAGEME
ncbi:MAG: LysR family transcriptional regulator substrate-binding protein [Leadbetterella sp.]|nr:LysR family transcriptional regulator substrate-binding protein [Leadbetterella sp.]